MSTAIETRKPPGPLTEPAAGFPALDEWRALAAIAEDIHTSGLYPRFHNPQSIMVAMQYGREIGVSPVTALQMIHVVDGKATAAAELMLQLVERSYGRGMMYVALAECDDKRAVVVYRDPETNEYQRYVYTIDMAATANLTGKANWKQYPANMLRWRAVSNVAKAIFPAAIGGLYAPDEMGASVAFDAEGNAQIIDVSSQRLDDDAPRSQRRRALHAVARDIGLWHDDLHARAQERFGVRSMTELTSEQIGLMLEQVQLERAVVEQQRQRDQEALEADARAMHDDDPVEGVDSGEPVEEPEPPAPPLDTALWNHLRRRISSANRDQLDDIATEINARRNTLADVDELRRLWKERTRTLEKRG